MPAKPKRKNERTIVFLGWYDRGNAGDEAFKDVHRLLFSEQNLIWTTNFSNVPTDLTDVVYVLGGGDVVSDFYIEKIPENAKFFMYGVGLASPDQREYIARLKERVLGVWVRNNDDAEALKALGVAAYYTPDIVFQLRSKIDAVDKSKLPELGPRKAILVMPSNNGAEAATRNSNIGMHYYYEFMLIEMAKTLDFVAKYYDIYFVPLSDNENDNDIIWIMRTVSAMSNKYGVKVIRDPMAPLEIAAFAARCDMVMSMKFHGLIFAILSGRPFVNIGLTRKTELLCADNGLAALSVPRLSFSYNNVIEALKNAEQPATRQAIESVSTDLQQAALAAGRNFKAEVEKAFDAMSS
jgi:polysaccharide pyruvyl transferase WcaK-like protein